MVGNVDRYDKLKNYVKIIKKSSGPVITSRGILLFLKTSTIATCLQKLGKLL
jgi:hypothetical protein